MSHRPSCSPASLVAPQVRPSYLPRSIVGPPSSHPSSLVITVTLRWSVISRWTPLCSLQSRESRLHSAFTLGCWPFLPPISHGLCFSPTGCVLLPDHAVSVSQFLLPLATVLTTRSEGSHPKRLRPPSLQRKQVALSFSWLQVPRLPEVAGTCAFVSSLAWCFL